VPIDADEDLDPIARDIWAMKYRLPGEESPAQTMARVARAVAQAEPEAAREQWAQAFEGLLADRRFLPAGRIIAGAGSGRRVTLFNCFVMGVVDDSMPGIFDSLKEAALTMQQGGGIGTDFSTLRPKGAPVRGVGADASGPLSFMDVWDAMCRTIMSAGSRRGAMMGTMRCDHPDIEAFIEAKRDPARLRMFNLSVLVTDAFMAAVKADADWPLTFGGVTCRTAKARALWDRIMLSTYETAEPGVIFIDRVNALNNLAYCETIGATNPCGEQPLPPYGACLLGSLNLVRFVERPFAADARLDLEALAEAAALAVRFLDDVIDISNYPLPEQAAEARAKRRIGLGVTGLADALAMCGLRYGTPASLEAAGAWMATIERAAYAASAGLAREKGAFALFDRDAYLAAGRLPHLPDDIRAAVAKHGIRNGLLTSVAPTGTISLFAGNVSSGVEPIFAYRYDRRILEPDGRHRVETVEDYAVRLWRRLNGDAPLPEAFVTAGELSPRDHLAMQAALQRHVDSAISKTINCPEDISLEAFRTIYEDAFDSGLKGCTTYRPNAITGAVLTPSPSPAPQATPAAEMMPALPPVEADGEHGSVVWMRQPLERSPVLPGYTYKLKWADSDHAIYITINDLMEQGRRRPFEIFINSKNMEHYAWTVALTRMISAVFRRGGDVSFVVEELKAVFDPRGGHWMEGRYVPSLLAAIGGVIERHMIDIGFLRRADDQEAAADASDPAAAPERAARRARRPAQCPRCGEAALVFQEGCASCAACGYSNCG
jgi:ribonucleoside-diphosphate reductase alpha chain